LLYPSHAVERLGTFELPAIRLMPHAGLDNAIYTVGQNSGYGSTGSLIKAKIKYDVYLHRS
jgi:hypothetical protein